jgi:hypothetical protein
MWRIGNNYFCVDCNLKWQQANYLSQRANYLSQQANYLSQQVKYLQFTIDAMLINQPLDGVHNIRIPPVIGGQFSLPVPTTTHTDQIIYNNIRVDRSVVGAVSTGTIQKPHIRMNAIRIGNNQELADILQWLIQTILDTPDVKASDKDLARECLSFLSNQALTQETERQPTIGKTAIATLERILSNTGSIASIWSAVKPLLETLF